MIVKKRGGHQPLGNFEVELGLSRGFSSRVGGVDDDAYLDAISWMQKSRPRKQNFWPALVLAFIAQCEEVLHYLGLHRDEDPFESFVVETDAEGQVRNTLNFVIGDDGWKATLRPFFNRAADVIRINMRRDHPSSPAHATQAWPAYRALVILIFQMRPEARARFAEHIWRIGVLEAPERRWAEQAERIVRPFEKVLTDFDTSGSTPGGALFQGLVYGYFTADSPNLTLESHAVNTGSSRADMPGDVAGFRGGEVELAVEVKDLAIGGEDVEIVLVDFLEDLVDAPNTTAVVVADSVDDVSRERLAKSNVIALDRKDLIRIVVIWDLPKQQEALRGAIYYLGRIQKNTKLVNTLVEFLTENEIATGIIDQPIVKDDSATLTT